MDHQAREAMAARGARRLRRGLVAAALVFLYLLGLGVRRYVFECQQPPGGRPLPFTLESALQYRLVRAVYTGEGIPRLDRAIEHPTGVRTFATDTVGVAEYMYAAACRLFPAELVLTERIRWIELAWFCLAIPLVAAWVRAVTGSWPGGLAAAFFYAVAVSSVLRSTGQEISHENFALPWLAAHLAAAATAERCAPGARRRWLAAASGLALALASATWDLVQFYATLWALAQAAAWLRRPRPLGAGDDVRAAGWAGLVLAGAASPYLRSHGFLLSPALLAGYGLLAGALWLRFRPSPAGRADLRAARALALLPAAGIAAAGAYLRSYGHFASLLWAKLRFLNVKPADPALLDFDQRILWTPALHSAGWHLVWTFFPLLLVLTWAALGVWYSAFRRNRGETARLDPIVFFYFASFLSFILFVRFQVFAALFSVALVGGWAAGAAARPGWRRWVSILALVGGGVGEAAHTIHGAAQWGRAGVYYPQLEELAAWLRREADGAPVLASFGTSAFALAHAGCPIVLHPKFESPENRRRVAAYGNLLFKGTEKELRDWAERYSVRFLVYGLGEFSPRDVTYQMRYMVNALEPPPYAPARLFETEPERPVYFRFLWGNQKYRVFRVLTRADEEQIDEGRRRARLALAAGDWAGAEAAATGVMRIEPRDAAAQLVLIEVEKHRARSAP